MLTQNFKDDKGGVHTCTDNAVSTLGKCIYYHGNQIPAQVVDKFLSALPLKTDTAEGQATHLGFFKQVLAINPNLQNHAEQVK